MTAVPSSPDARQELEALLRSRVPLVVIETRDEPRALELLASLAPRLAAAHTPVFQWTVTDGLRRLDVNLGGAQQHNAEPAAVLKSIRASDKSPASTSCSTSIRSWPTRCTCGC